MGISNVVQATLGSFFFNNLSQNVLFSCKTNVFATSIDAILKITPYAGVTCRYHMSTAIDIKEEWSSNPYCRNHILNCFKCILCRWLYIYLNNKLIEHCTHHV